MMPECLKVGLQGGCKAWCCLAGGSSVLLVFGWDKVEAGQLLMGLVTPILYMSCFPVLDWIGE